MSIFRKASATQRSDEPGRFQNFNLTENPFPSEPVVNQESEDKRINGNLYEVEIRREEYDLFLGNFLKKPRSAPNHLRLGFLVDTSYIGRGNGKSAFLVNLQQQINSLFCLDLSEGVNKCFATTVIPAPGGRTRSFQSVADLIFESVDRSDLLNEVLGMLRFLAIEELYPALLDQFGELEERELLLILNDEKRLKGIGIDLSLVAKKISQFPQFARLSSESPVHSSARSLFEGFLTAEAIKSFYSSLSHRPNDRVEFLLNDVVEMFSAAGFNGGFVFIDDFERVPTFQNARQKKDFALELRTALYDGLSANARYGFFTFVLVLHAGVPRLIADAWSESGMENRSPIEPRTESSHFVAFKPLSKEHALLLVQRYLLEYRIDAHGDKLHPFTEEAVAQIGEMSEYNAARILKTCYALLELASNSATTVIDDSFVSQSKGAEQGPLKPAGSIVERESIDLTSKIEED